MNTILNFLEFLKNSVDVFQILAALAAAISVYYLAKQITMFVGQERVSKAYEYIKRFNSPEFRQNIAITKGFLMDDHRLLEAKLKTLSEDSELMSHLVLVLNFFEEMGLFYNKDLADRHLIREFFQSISKTYFDYAASLIGQWRKDSIASRYFVHWEEMNKTFE